MHVDRETIASIDAGLLVFAAVGVDDTREDREWIARKVADLRIFDDVQGVMNRSVIDARVNVLAVSQFTLFASTRKGHRPSWSRAAPPTIAAPAFDDFVRMLEARLDARVATGRFGANMQVALVNDGPVTIWLDSRQRE